MTITDAKSIVPPDDWLSLAEMADMMHDHRAKFASVIVTLEIADSGRVFTCHANVMYTELYGLKPKVNYCDLISSRAKFLPAYKSTGDAITRIVRVEYMLLRKSGKIVKRTLDSLSDEARKWDSRTHDFRITYDDSPEKSSKILSASLPAPAVPVVAPPTAAPLPPTSKARWLQPIAPTTWVTTADYPPEAKSQKQEGFAGFRIVVDKDGLPTRCEITQSSGFAALDAMTCQRVMERARFQPALDAEGHNIESSWSGRVRWSVPME